MTRREITPLTGLRAFAALAVVIYNHRRLVHTLPGLPDGFGSHGYLGVDVFFVLSGFVLSLNYGGRIHSVRHYLEFIGYRIARLYPLHFFTLAGVLVLAHIALRAGWTIHQPEHFVPDRHLLLHLLLIHSWGFEEGLRFNLPAWSVSAEFFAYLLFPLHWAVAARARSAWISGLASITAVWASIALLRGMGHDDLHVVVGHTLIRVTGGFLAGCFVFRALQLRSSIAPAANSVYTATIIACAAAAASPWADPLVAVAACPLIYALARGSGPGVALFATRPVVWLGQISYAIYLTHMPVASLLRRLVPGVDTGLTPLQAVGLLVLDAALVVSVSAACYYAVEIPGRRWLRGLVRSRLATPRRPAG